MEFISENNTGELSTPDSAYGASENSKSASCNEEETMEFCDEMSSPESCKLPRDFHQLITSPLINRTESICDISPLFDRFLNIKETNNTKLRSSLFGSSELRSGSFKRSKSPTPDKKISKIFRHDLKETMLFSSNEEVMCALQKSSDETDLIGDFTKKFCLPLTASRKDGIKAITPTTLIELINGQFDSKIASFKIIDCRYPYEFDGGHIQGAVNIYDNKQCSSLLLQGDNVPAQYSPNRNILIFHCEFSSKRGPRLYQYLRGEDRKKNEYPSLHYPEIYLLEGGYRKFFEQYPQFCVPVAYREMVDPKHAKDLLYFEKKSKSGSGEFYKKSLNRMNSKRLAF